MVEKGRRRIDEVRGVLLKRVFSRSGGCRRVRDAVCRMHRKCEGAIAIFIIR